MKILYRQTLPVLFAMAGIGLAGATAHAQDTAKDAQAAPKVEERMTGQTPEDALMTKRAGAIGENPDQVQQGGAGGPEASAAAAPTGDAPDGTLMEKRTGTIGDTEAGADPVIQGGAGDTAEKRRPADMATGDAKAGADDTAALEDTKALRLMGKPAELASGEKVGTVDDIIIDQSDATARELVVLTGTDGRKVTVDAEKAKLGEDNATVIIDLDQAEFAELPDYDPAATGDMSIMVGEEKEKQ